MISVCIPTYNSQSYIQRCLESVFQQNVDDIEIIVSDNDSSDRTVEIVESFRDSRIRVFRQSRNKGYQENFNFAIAQATGDLIKTFCSDDVMLPTLLHDQQDVFSEFPRVGIVSCHSLVVPQVGPRFVWEVHSGYSTGETLLHESIKKLANRYGGPSSFMFRRSAIQSVKFDASIKYISDVDIGAHVMFAGWDFFGLPQVGIEYVCHPGQVTHNVLEHETEDWILLMVKTGAVDFDSARKLLNRNNGKNLNETLVSTLINHPSLSVTQQEILRTTATGSIHVKPSTKTNTRRVLDFFIPKLRRAA